MTQLLSHLLPYDIKTKKFKTANLKEYQLLLSIASEAIATFEGAEYEKFDSLVGENACQIRAIWVAKLGACPVLHFEILKKEIARVHHLLDVLISENTSYPQDYFLGDLFSQKKLEMSLTLDEMFLLLAFILTEMKVVKSDLLGLVIKESSDPKKLKRFGEVSSTFVDILVRQCRKLLSALSVHFVRSSALLLQNEDLIEMTSGDYIAKANNFLPCIPMYWTYDTLLSLAQEAGIPIVLYVQFLAEDEGNEVVNEESVLFQASEVGYLESLPSSEILDQGACIIKGVIRDKRGQLPSKEEWKAKIVDISLKDVILAGAADHRQYPDSELEGILDGLEDQKYEYHKALAKKEGFSLCNPKCFFIQHVYAAQIGNVNGMKEKAYNDSFALVND